MDHPMTHATVMSFACLSCGMGFRKDLQLFGDADECCPHCGVAFVIPARTNEGMLFDFGVSECDKMLNFACETGRAIKTDSQLKNIGFILDDEASIHSDKNEEQKSREEELARRKTKLMNIKNKRKSKAGGGAQSKTATEGSPDVSAIPSTPSAVTEAVPGPQSVA
jgi:hypothetical protein